MKFEVHSSRKVLASVLKLSEDQISEDVSIDNCDEWTSLAHLNLVNTIEEITGRKLGSIEIMELVDLQGIAKVLVD